MAVMDNFYFSMFLRLTWEFLGLESECGGSVCWSNNKIIDSRTQVSSRKISADSNSKWQCAIVHISKQ